MDLYYKVHVFERKVYNILKRFSCETSSTSPQSNEMLNNARFLLFYSAPNHTTNGLELNSSPLFFRSCFLFLCCMPVFFYPFLMHRHSLYFISIRSISKKSRLTFFPRFGRWFSECNCSWHFFFFCPIFLVFCFILFRWTVSSVDVALIGVCVCETINARHLLLVDLGGETTTKKLADFSDSP